MWEGSLAVLIAPLVKDESGKREFDPIPVLPCDRIVKCGLRFMDRGRIMYRNIAVTIILVAASLGLASAQVATPSPMPRPAPLPPQDTLCKVPPKGPALSNLHDGFRDALAREWLDPEAAPLLTDALATYVENGDAKKLLHALLAGTPEEERHNKGRLYTAALGNPDENGYLTVKALPDVLDILATANTCKQKMTPLETEHLFASANTIIDRVFPDAMIAMIRVDDLFAWDKYQAFSQLLKTLQPSTDETYAKDLEILRFAFQQDSSRLAKNVSEKISPPKKTPPN
jgi:hypothetical protein